MAYASKKKLSDNSIVPLGSNLYGTCSTANSTATKTVVMPDFNVLVEGVTIHVYFQNENTADAPTLKVGSTSAQPIRYNGQVGGSWEAGGFISFTYYNGSWVQNDITIAGVTYTFSISGHTMTISGSDGSVQTITLPDNDTTYTLSKSGSTVTLTGSDGSTSSVTDADTKYGLQLQNGKLKLVEGGSTSEITLPDDDTTYTLSISGHTVTMTGSDGTTSSVTIPDANTTYSLSKSGNTITLTGSDGSTTSVTDSNTTYSGMTQAQGEAGTSTTNMVISPKVLHDVIEAMDDDTTYSLSISGHTLTLTPSSGSAQSVTVPDNNTTYTISKSGNTVTLTGSDGSTQTFTDSDTTYSAGTGLQLSGTTFSVKTGYTTSGNNRKVQADSNGNLYVVQKDDNTTYSAGTGLSLSGTTFNHSNSVTAVTSASFVKVKYDAQGHITGTDAVTKADITALGIPGSDTNNRRVFYGTCTTAAATAEKAVTLSNTTGWELVAGTVVGVKWTNTNTASSVKLNVNGTGAKSIYYAQAVYTGTDSNITGYANRTSFYMYDGTNWVWIQSSQYWGNTYDRTYLSNSGYKAGSSAIVAGNIITANSSGLYQHLKSGAAFDITMPILYASSAATANAVNNGGYLIIPFTITTTQSLTLTAYKPIYIKGQLSGKTFTPISTTPLTQTEPTSADGYEYMLLGYATTTTVAYLLPEHPIYAYTGGAFTRIGGRGITNITRSGTTFTVTREDNSTFTFTQQDNNTTYTAGTGLELSGTEFKAKLGYTTSGNNRKVQADSSGNLYVVQKDDNTTYSAGTGLDLSGTTFNHENAVTALTTEGLRKVKYDAQGHITGSSAVAKADITALGIPSSDTNNRRGFYGTCTTAAATAAKVVTLGSTAGWELVAGTIVGVKFSYTNTASNPTLNVNSSGAKSIIYNTGTITTSNLNKAGYANRIEYYMYDGSHWVWMNWSVDDNTWQSNTNARAGYVESGANQANKVWATDGNGNPAWRSRSGIMCYCNTFNAISTAITATNTYFTANLNTPLINQGAPFSLTSGNLVCDRPGLYLVSLMASFNPATSGDIMGVRLNCSLSGIVSDETVRVGGSYDSISVPMRPHRFEATETIVAQVRNATAGRGTCTGVRLLLYYVDYD